MQKIVDYCSNRKESQHSEEYALILQRLINARGKDGKAPLHDAMELVGRRDIFSNVNLSTIGDLIRIGANFDARDK